MIVQTWSATSCNESSDLLGLTYPFLLQSTAGVCIPRCWLQAVFHAPSELVNSWILPNMEPCDRSGLLILLTLSCLCVTVLSGYGACGTSTSASHIITPPQNPIVDINASAVTSNRTLHITALTNHPSPPYTARMQCWSLNDTFTHYPTVGKSLPLGDVDNMTYVVLPPRSAEGWHRPPHPMFFVLLSGVAQVYVPRGDRLGAGLSRRERSRTLAEVGSGGISDGAVDSPDQPLPDSKHWDSITITPGSLQQVLIAADTDVRALGHLTFYPGNGETVALQIPLALDEGGLERFGYTFSHEGGCTGEE